MSSSESSEESLLDEGGSGEDDVDDGVDDGCGDDEGCPAMFFPGWSPSLEWFN